MQDTYVVLPPSQSSTTENKVKQELSLALLPTLRPEEVDSVASNAARRYRRDFDNDKPRIKVGNSETLARSMRVREERERHERNKEVWYARNAHLVDGDEYVCGCKVGLECGYGYDDDEDDSGGSDLTSDDEDDNESHDSDNEDSDGIDADPLLFDGRPEINKSTPTSPSVTYGTPDNLEPGGQASRINPEQPLTETSTSLPKLYDTSLFPMTRPRRSSVDIQQQVVQEEADIHASRAAAASFYLPTHLKGAPTPSHRRQRLSEFRQGRARAQTTGANQTCRQWDDELLMLFREPPPWSALAESRDAVFASSVSGSSGSSKEGNDEGRVAVLSRSNKKGADGVKELTEMVKRRKLATVETSIQTAPVAVIMPRNPFRRKPNHEENSKSSAPSTITSSRPPLSIVPTTRQSIMDISLKPLKPITSLKVPLLPEALLRDEMNSAEQALSSEGKRLLANIDGSSDRTLRSRVDTPNASLKSMVKNITASNSASTKATHTRASVKASDNVRTRSKSTGNVKGAVVFDWRGWSSK